MTQLGKPTDDGSESETAPLRPQVVLQLWPTAASKLKISWRQIQFIHQLFEVAA